MVDSLPYYRQGIHSVPIQSELIKRQHTGRLNGAVYKSLLTALSILLFSTYSQAQQQEVIEFPSAEKNTPYKQVSALSFRQPDQKVKYGSEHSDQYAAFWAPSLQGDKPVIVFIHGGCWLSAFDIKHSYALSTALSQQGYPVWSIEYRRAGNGGEWPVALNDLSLGLKALSVLSEEGYNTKQIHIIGHSAGGHLAAMLAAKLEDALPLEVMKADVIGLAGIMNVVDYANGDNSCQSATPNFLSGLPEDATQNYYLANPQNYQLNGEKLGAFILLQGTQDSIVPPSQAQHPRAKTLLQDGVGHFDWIHPGSYAFKQLLITLESLR